MTAAGDSRLTTTRRNLHAVAEGLLAAPQYRATATLRLTVRAGGFATNRPYGTCSLVAVDGNDLLVTCGDIPLRLPPAGTSGDLAAAAGLPVGSLEDVYPDSVRPEPPPGSTSIPALSSGCPAVSTTAMKGNVAVRRFATRAVGTCPTCRRPSPRARSQRPRSHRRTGPAVRQVRASAEAAQIVVARR